MTVDTRRLPTVAVAEPTGPRGIDDAPTTEQVARTITGTPTIGEARAALTNAGWRASIAGNRITVNDEVFAQFFGARDSADASWVIYRATGTPPVWVVGTRTQQR